MTALSAIHAGCKQLGIDEDTRRDLYERVTGKRSAKDMNAAERERVVSELRRLGFAPTFKAPPSVASGDISPSRGESGRRASRKPLAGPFAAKLQALWIAAWNLGIVENRDDAALIAFVRRQTGIDHTRFLTDAGDAHKAIEALKAWMEREGGVDWHVGNHMPKIERLNGFKIAWAQWRLMRPGGMKAARSRAFNDDVKAIAGVWPVEMVRERDWVPVMNTFGAKVRKMKGKKG